MVLHTAFVNATAKYKILPIIIFIFNLSDAKSNTLIHIIKIKGKRKEKKRLKIWKLTKNRI